MQRLRALFSQLLGGPWIPGLLIALTVFFTLKAAFGPVSMKGVYTLTQYNNFLIFKQSFFHLIEHQSLYAKYPVEHWDFFKYSPTFAMLFGLFALLPLWTGMLLWGLVNAGILIQAFRLMPAFDTRTKSLMLLFIAPELFNSIQNEQSNALMAGLILMAFALCERKYLFWACACIALSIYIKLFSAAALALFIFYPGKGRAILYMLFWMVLLFLLPVVVTGWNELLWQYQEWFALIKMDTVTDYALSVMHLVKTFFHVSLNDLVVQALSALVLMLPLLRWKEYGSFTFRMYLLSSVLVWCVIFNHKAESPTFVIAASGIILWYFSAPRSTWHTVLVFAVLLFTSLSTTDLFPKDFRDGFLKPMLVKVWPCIVAWVVIVGESLVLPFRRGIVE